MLNRLNSEKKILNKIIEVLEEAKDNAMMTCSDPKKMNESLVEDTQDFANAIKLVKVVYNIDHAIKLAKIILTLTPE